MNKFPEVSVMLAPGVYEDGIIVGSDHAGKGIVQMGHRNQANKSWFYASKFLRLRCAVDLLKIYNRASDPIKEMSEIWGIWEAIIKQLKLDPKGNIRAVVVGDGNTPRMGAFLACMTQWDVLSFDPAFAEGSKHVEWDHIERLETKACKLEDFGAFNLKNREAKETIIVLPHAHANAQLSLTSFASYGSKTHMISMPCCMYQEQVLTNKPTYKYIDKNVMSDKNEIFIWENLP